MAMKTKKKVSAPPVTELLHEDHLKVRDLFFKFREAESSTEKAKLVQSILTELFIHSTIEEEIVYPEVKSEAEEGEELVDEAETEHRVVKFLMAELSQMKPADEQYDAKVTVLCELVDHHIREEEKEMFKKLNESGVDLEELSVKMLERKEILMGQPLPEMDCSLSIEGETEPAKKKASSTKSTKRPPAKLKKSA